MKRIALIVQLPKSVSPGQRFRVEIWEPVLRQSGYETVTYSFLDRSTHNILYRKGHYVQKLLGVLKGYLKRFILIFRLKKYDFIFLQREFAPLGPPVFEWIVSKILRKKIIYDFDDAIWIPNTSSSNKLAGWAKCHWKVRYICRWSYKVVGGNEFLCNYARRYNNQVVLIPTCVDTETGHGKMKLSYFNEKPVVGWTGSHSTLKYIDYILPVIKKLQEQYDFCFSVIADKDPLLPLRNYRFIKWQAQTENEDLLQLDIGVMPLTSDEWSEGKCGFKLIQYFATGIPAIASPVGVNKKIVEEGVNGFLCADKTEWEMTLVRLLIDASLRERMGKAGRKMVEERYSVLSQKELFLGLFE